MNVLFEEMIPGGGVWSHTLKKGTALRVTDPRGGACGALSFYNPRDLSERYNMPDTLKGQHTAILTKGHALYSDMGRILLSILEDSFGAHDPISGLLTQEELEQRFGHRPYQKFRNDWHQSGLSQMWTEIGKYALDIRDLSSVVNLFGAVTVSEKGELKWDPSRIKPGNSILLRAEMDTLVVLAATQHPFDPRKHWDPLPLNVQITRLELALEDNPAWKNSPQNQRGFANTFLYNL